MKNFIILGGLIFIGVMAWRLSDYVSHDAVIMATGFLFGALAGVPVALIVLAAQRRQLDAGYQQRRDDYHQPQAYQPHQQPMVVYPGQQPQAYHVPQPQPQQPQWPTGGGGYNLLPNPQDGRFGEADSKRAWRGR